MIADAVAGLGGLFLLWVFLYFIPTIVALARKSHQGAMVFVINLFLGWTFIGWVIALAMAFSRPTVVMAAAPPLPHGARSADGRWWWDTTSNGWREV